MIPFEDLERALARWKSRGRDGATPEPTGEVDMRTGSRGVSNLPPPMEQSGEIDLNDDVVESVDLHHRR